eukprot:scaffold60766_cov21-Tisochrysis_lutea.AAC.1
MPALTPFLCVWNDSSHPPQCTGPDHLHKLPLCIHLQAGFQVIAVEQPDPELTTCYSLYLLFESVVRSWGPSLKNCVTLCNLAHMQASANPFCQVALPTLCKARWPASKWHKGIAETADRNRATVGSNNYLIKARYLMLKKGSRQLFNEEVLWHPQMQELVVVQQLPVAEILRIVLCIL